MLEDVIKKVRTTPPLDPGFAPALFFEQVYRQRASDTCCDEVLFSLVRGEGKSVSFRREISLDLLTESEEYLERTIKFYLWAFGGHTLYVRCHESLRNLINRSYGESGRRSFDTEIMEKVFGQPFRVEFVNSENDMPKEVSFENTMGGNMNGCRIGFDLGASDFKLAAVRDGEVLYTDEIPWDPVTQTDPDYHWSRILGGLEKAASFLPRVDCIGGSSAGIIQENRVRVASLFRSVPAERFSSEVANIFERLQSHWKVPVIVENDGDVSALAGAMSLDEKGILGIAMGSSEAVGFLDRQGNITGQLNELAFAPVDANPQAAIDEWSKDSGVGALYFSQQAVNKLLPAAGIEVDAGLGLPERLKVVQKLANEGDARASQIYQTIGCYLGYTVPYYAEFYDFDTIMVFGRVTSGTGGDIIIHTAQKILDEEFGEKGIQLSVPDEKFRRVGQAVAAASLPELSGAPS